jgi:hypothetical protein
MAESIVQAAFLRIGEHRVGLGRLLERLLRLVISGIAVGMMLQRKLAVRALDLLIRGLTLDAQDLVVITLAHACPHASPFATFTIEGRRSRSPSM